MNCAGLNRNLKLAVTLLAAVLLAPLAAQAQIAFRNAASATAQGPAFRAAASASNGISFVGAGAQVASETTGATITPALPSGTVANDFAILIVAGRPTDTTEPATPSGWTLRSSSLREVGANDLKIMTFYRVLAGGDANPGVVLPASWGGGGGTAGMSAQIAVWRNVNTSTPFDVADVTGSAAAASTWAPPGITTTTNGALVVSAVATSDDNALGFSSAQGFTLRMSGASYDTTTGGDHAIGLAEKIQSGSGSVTNPTWQQVNSPSDSWAGITFALRPGTGALTIAKPTGTAQNDVMIASIGFRPNTATITPPAGWTLVGSRIDCTLDLNYNSLAVYRKTAGASEPTTYTWTFGGASDAVGGIQSFSGVDTTTPVDVSGGQAIASTLFPSYATPSVNTTVGGTLLVTSHTFSTSGTSGSTWSAPSGMTEAYDIASLPGPTDAGQSIGAYYGPGPAAAGATGPKTATASYAADCGAAHILALRPLATVLTISKPTGTVNGDFMVAAIAIQPYTATITPPSGWTLLRRTDTAGGTSNALEIFTKAAGASEPASYTWTLGAFAHAAGGIQSFSGVDIAAGAVNVENGQSTGSGTSHDAPSITPTVANTMLVTAHTLSSSRTWTQPTGMSEAYDIASLPTSNAEGQSIVGSYQPHVFLATGIKTATVGGNADTGNAHILALRPLPVAGVTGGFNGYDTGTIAGATSGFIQTKIAGSTVSVAIIALNWPRTAIETGFTGTVKVEVLDASNNTGALDVNGCRSTWTVLQTLSPDLTFVSGDNGRKNVSFTQANSYKDLRVRVSYPTTSPTQIGCSNDNFAMRPDQFTFTVTDNDWQTAGSARTLDNVNVPGGIVHKAGRPFTVQATALNAVGATTTNYVDTPSVIFDPGGCTGTACTTTYGTLTLGGSFVAGVLNSSTATYSEVGAIRVRIRDTVFSNVDASDGSSGAERNISSSNIDVGRFVPDNFAIALNTPSFGTTCGSFTYLGQPFNYTVAPVITVTARNFAGATTTAYAGARWQITSASLTGKSYTWAAGTLDTSGITGTDPVIASVGSGVGTLTFGSGTGLFFTRTTPVAPFDADISLAINVIDADGVSYASNPARFGQATAGNGIAFSSGKSQRFGRLTIRNANGSQLLPLFVQVEAQYWPGAPTNAFITNTLDNCTAIASANDAMGNYTGNLSACETAISGGGTLSAGRRTLVLAAPGSGNTGSVNLTVNLGASASGSTCTTLGGSQVSATTANLPHLQGNWSGGAYNQNPSARATFGISRGAEEVVFVRENF
jgi:hypothetical protein